MAFAEIWWFWKGLSSESFIEAIDGLVRAGLQPACQGGRRHYLDQDGAQVPWNEEFLVSQWKEGHLVNVQLWASADADVVVTAEREHDLFTLDLDGVTYVEARRIVDCALDAAISVPGTRLLVLDRGLPDRGDEWLRFVDGTSQAAPYEPDLMLTRMNAGGQFMLQVRPNSWFVNAAQ